MPRSRSLVTSCAALFLAVIAAALALGACDTLRWRARFVRLEEPVKVDLRAPFAKCHTNEGGVYVLKSWQLDAAKRTVTGEGLRYDASRKVVGRGRFVVPFKRIALLETNRPERISARGEFGVLATVTVASAVATPIIVYCSLNPKACFGSCPTFYVDDGSQPTLQAEGFSAAVARSLEETDVDALFAARPRGRRVTVRMTNEALETHLVRGVQLLVAPRPAGGGRVGRVGDSYFGVSDLRTPSRCRAASGDCTAALRSFADQREYLSATDAHDLLRQETVELTFAPRRGSEPLALLIGARNSLLNTFLFYQALAYMGRYAAAWQLRLDRGDPDLVKAVRGLGRSLGGIQVTVYDRRTKRWVKAAERFSETGPIAREVQLVRLPVEVTARSAKRPLRLRLTMTRGNFKVDYVALARLGRRVQPLLLEPARVTSGGAVDARAALALLRDPRRFLVTMPKEAYALHYQLPGDARGYELFLRSRGYYVEWMRQHWLADENAAALVEMFTAPRRAMRRLAPRYKRVEATMESVFWSTRLRAPSLREKR